MKLRLTCAALILSLTPAVVVAQNVAALDKATTKCLFDTPGAENLHVTLSQTKSGKATLSIRKKAGATDATVQAYRACVAARARGGKLSTASDPVVVPEHSTKPVRAYRKKNRNPLCPDYAPVMYRGTIYCIGNQS